MVEREEMANGDSGKAALLAAEDENAIRSVLARLCDAWARGDGEAYAACFAENSDYITFNGMHLRGRAENAKLHSALFRGVLKGTKLSAEIESLELLASGVALIHTAGSGRKTSRQTYVLVKSGADWLISDRSRIRGCSDSAPGSRAGCKDAPDLDGCLVSGRWGRFGSVASFQLERYDCE
jgi:uncharacterized protein (TIGR02246 family)